MHGSDDETIPEQPAHWADARPTRVLIAAIVVLGAAGLGYLASRMWPLTAFSGSRLQVESTSKPKAFEPIMVLSAVAAREAEFAEPSASVASRPREQSQLPAPAKLAEVPAPANLANTPRNEIKSETRNEPPDPTQVTANASFVVLNAGTAEQPTDDEKVPSKAEPSASNREGAEAARREGTNKKKPSRVMRAQRDPEAAPKNAKSAAAGAALSDPALREFMTNQVKY